MNCLFFLYGKHIAILCGCCCLIHLFEDHLFEICQSFEVLREIFIKLYLAIAVTQQSSMKSLRKNDIAKSKSKTLCSHKNTKYGFFKLMQKKGKATNVTDRYLWNIIKINVWQFDLFPLVPVPGQALWTHCQNDQIKSLNICRQHSTELVRYMRHLIGCSLS